MPQTKKATKGKRRVVLKTPTNVLKANQKFGHKKQSLHNAVKAFSCGVCYSAMISLRDATVASCGHSLCKTCWEHITKETGPRRPLKGPFCREEVIFLAPNVELNGLLDSMYAVGVRCNKS